jgi:hypothetical protein
MTRILVLNGSPRDEKSNTHVILTPFTEGMREAGAEVETLVVRDLDIGFCRGCHTCWWVTPGVCCQEDDMTEVLEKFQEADYVIYATPLYHFGMAAKIKALMERTLPLIDARLVHRGDRTSHDVRGTVRKLPRFVLVSNCGFPEKVHFGALVEQFRHLTGGRGPAASILIPAGEALGRRYAPGDWFDWFYDSLRQAGRELVTQGRFSPETEEALARPLVPADLYVTGANAGLDATLAEIERRAAEG